MINVLLTDDHALVRTGIKRLLEDSKRVSVIGEASSGEECLQKVAELRPDIILMDLNMPGIDGIETCRRLLQHDAAQKIIILTIHSEQAFPKRLLEIGAKGYLTKECDVNIIIEAIESVHQGGSYIEPRIAQQLALSMLPGNQHRIDRLSRREFQVMLMLANGRSNLEISEKLCLSPKTVSTYRSRILEKLEADSEADLVKVAVEMGMIDFSEHEFAEMMS